jgi:hypothetical protein
MRSRGRRSGLDGLGAPKAGLQTRHGDVFRVQENRCVPKSRA